MTQPPTASPVPPASGPPYGPPASGPPSQFPPPAGLSPDAGLPSQFPSAAGPHWVPPAPRMPQPASSGWQPERVDPLPGTQFGLVQLKVQPITSGLAIGSLIAGIATILVAGLVLCFGLAGAGGGWGGWVAGAFTVLNVVVGGGAIALGSVARRQIKHSGQAGQVRFTGRRLAIAGISCGAAGAGIALVSLALTLAVQLSS